MSWDVFPNVCNVLCGTLCCMLCLKCYSKITAGYALDQDRLYLLGLGIGFRWKKDVHLFHQRNKRHECEPVTQAHQNRPRISENYLGFVLCI